MTLFYVESNVHAEIVMGQTLSKRVTQECKMQCQVHSKPWVCVLLLQQFSCECKLKNCKWWEILLKYGKNIELLFIYNLQICLSIIRKIREFNHVQNMYLHKFLTPVQNMYFHKFLTGFKLTLILCFAPTPRINIGTNTERLLHGFNCTRFQ